MLNLDKQIKTLKDHNGASHQGMNTKNSKSGAKGGI
jgi:hypothetical protein